MTSKRQPKFGDHVRRKLPDISYFTVFLSGYAVTHFKTVRKCRNPNLLKYTLRKKKCNIPSFLRGAFPLLYMYSNF